MSTPPLATILLVRDEGDLLEVLSFVLEDAGYRVLAAAGSAEALALAETESIDLVILDISASDMSGLDVARALRASPHSRAVLIAVHTELPEEAIRADAPEVDVFIAQIDDANILLQRVAEVLSSRAGAAAIGVATAEPAVASAVATAAQP